MRHDAVTAPTRPNGRASPCGSVLVSLAAITALAAASEGALAQTASRAATVGPALVAKEAPLLISVQPALAASASASASASGPARASIKAAAVAEQPLVFEQRRVWVQKDESAGDILGRGGITVNGATIESLRRLNPAIRPDGTVPAGTRLTYFAPSGPQVGTDLRAPVDMARVARASIAPQAVAARQLATDTRLLTASAYQRPADLQRHLKLVGEIDRTATLVEQRADQLSARDLALSRIYLIGANARARSLTTASALQPIASDQLTQLQGSVQPLQTMSARIERGGSPFDYRAVTVEVAPTAPATKVAALRVYVLPAYVIDYPQSFDVQQVRQWLEDLTFESLTSPASGTVPQAEVRLWIGPDFAYEQMARAVVEGRLTQYRALHPAPDATQASSLRFVAPADVVAP
jgi:hypothetical protein